MGSGRDYDYDYGLSLDTMPGGALGGEVGEMDHVEVGTDVEVDVSGNVDTTVGAGAGAEKSDQDGYAVAFERDVDLAKSEAGSENEYDIRPNQATINSCPRLEFSQTRISPVLATVHGPDTCESVPEHANMVLEFETVLVFEGTVAAAAVA